ncbi:MAG: hypothetical protein QOG34_761 [Frankiaceae bacterium]|jgi:type II secretory pathway pseudopilin PulG|nr:hypothetical protein [Frankiaceae bacterium]
MHRQPGGGDRGDSLVEVLLAVVITSIAVVSILTGMSTLTSGSAVHRDQADVETVLRSAAEQVVSTQSTASTYIPYKTCAVVSDYQSKVTATSGYTTTVKAVKYWDGTLGGGSFVSTCPSTDRGMQLVTVEVKKSGVPGVTADETVDVVKRQP